LLYLTNKVLEGKRQVDCNMTPYQVQEQE